jgi:hypothetical protein
MGKGANNGENGRLYITATPELRHLLDGLAALGIHGGSAAEVARHFVENEVERMVRDGVIAKALESRRLIALTSKPRKEKGVDRVKGR